TVLVVSFLQLVPRSDLPRTAGAIQQEEFLLAGKFSFLPILVQGANVADERRDASNRAHQQMVSASAAGLQCKPSFGNLSHLNFVAHLQFVDERGQFTLGDELK